MKRVNIHHFPQNPFQEQIYHRHHHHHHHRRYSFGHAHRNSLHSSHHHHHFLSSFASRTLKSSFDSTRLSHVREQLEMPISRDNIESILEEQSIEPPTPPPQRVTDTRSDLTSLSNEDNKIMTLFLKDYLGRDGALVLYLLKINTNEVITGEIVTALFELFKTNYRTNTTE